MSDLSSVLESIETSKVKEYFFRPIPDAIDTELADCLRQYAAASNAEKEKIRSLVSPKHSYGLLAFAERMAVLSVRQQSVDPISIGLSAIALEDYRLDAREDLMIMALLLNSTRRIGSDPVPLFESAAGQASGAVGESMRQFVKERKDDAKIVQRMGYKEVSLDGQFSYRRSL